MDNDKKLFEALLKADGINPSAPTEAERTVFKEMLDSEKKLFSRLSWRYVGAMWVLVLAMLGLCLYEKIPGALRIPFVVGCLVVIVAMLIVMIRHMLVHNRKMIESGRKINKLHYLVHGKHRGLIMIGQKDGKRHIYWLRIIMIAAGLWLAMSLGGAGVFYLLCQRWIYASGPNLYIEFCAVFSLSFVTTVLYAGFKTPLDELPEVKTKPKRSKPDVVRPDIWRIIMQSKITKLTAAAAIILVAITIINQFGGSIDVASVAWADVVEEINNYTRYKCRQRVVREKGPQHPTMDVYHMNLSLRRQEVEDGSIHIIDMRGADAITVELKPAEMKATVTKLIGFGPRKDPHIIEMVKRFEQESTERLGTKEVDGKILQGFRHAPNKGNDFTVWVDPETKLPVEIELKHTKSPMGQTIFMDEFEFDFELDESAFSTDIPDGYEVEILTQDYRPFEPKEITGEDIQSNLNHTAYTVEKLPWMEKITTIETIEPLGSKAIVYITGIQSSDGNTIIIVQGNYYDIKKMVWIPKQQLVLEAAGGAELYTHPNGALYAKRFLKSFAKAKPGFFDIKGPSKERFTWMIVMPDGTVMSLSAKKQMSDEMVQELVESLTEISQASHKADSNNEQEYTIQSPDGPQEFIPYSCTETIYRGGEEFFHKRVSHITRSLRREIHSDDDSIHIVDLSERPVRILRMDPKNMKASLKILHNMGPAKNPDMLAMLASMRKYDSKKLGIQEIDGISAEGFLDAYRDITIWADMETGLPVKIEVVHARRNGKIVLTDFDFETVLDESLFSTVPPEGYDLKTKTVPKK